jgi:ubiquinone/menaquinone biosynthesis C-methylase UbiE
VSLQELFREPLRDLGEVDARLHGILEPEGERGARPSGVTAQFLEDAGDYHARYSQVAWFRQIIGRALAGHDDRAIRRILDIGSGSGNSVIPLLELYPDAFVVATDISAPLLAILRDRLEPEPRYRGRFALVRMDANHDRFRERAFDLAVGAAILHHIRDPGRVLRACAAALRPGASALFIEPFETGHGVMRIAYRRILAEAARRGEDGGGFGMLRRMIADHEARLRDKSDPIFETLDDKWLFTRAWFEQAAAGPEWEGLRIEGLGTGANPIADRARTELRLGLGADESTLPRWAWDLLAEHEAAFSRDGLRDLLFEATVTLRRGDRAPAPASGRRPGWWWNPAQSGRGFFVEFHAAGSRAACCHYADDGEPAWSVADASALDLSGNVDTLGLELGGVMLRLTPQYGESPRDPRTGWWVDRSQPSASMIVVECLGEQAVAAALTADGWCLCVASRDGAQGHAGEWLRFRAGQTATGPYRPPEAPRPLGPARLAWPDGETLVARLAQGSEVRYRRLGPAEPAPQNLRSTEKCAS